MIIVLCNVWHYNWQNSDILWRHYKVKERSIDACTIFPTAIGTDNDLMIEFLGKVHSPSKLSSGAGLWNLKSLGSDSLTSEIPLPWIILMDFIFFKAFFLFYFSCNSIFKFLLLIECDKGIQIALTRSIYSLSLKS